MSSCTGHRLLCGYAVRESPATVMISFSMTFPYLLPWSHDPVRKTGSHFSGSCDEFYFLAFSRAYHGVEHRHAVQHLVDVDRVRPLPGNAAAELHQLGVEHV